MAGVPWHILTGEYPPRPGGVSDYSAHLAGGLARAGAEVHVWAPAAETEGPAPTVEGVVVHRLTGVWSRAGLARLGEALDAFAPPRRLLVMPGGTERQRRQGPECARHPARGRWPGRRRGFSARGVLVGGDDGRVAPPRFPVGGAAPSRPHAGPDAGLGPAVELRDRGVPDTEPLGSVAPTGSGAGAPEDGVTAVAVISDGDAGVSARPGRRGSRRIPGSSVIATRRALGDLDD